jgi:hypothetical protein
MFTIFYYNFLRCEEEPDGDEEEIRFTPQLNQGTMFYDFLKYFRQKNGVFLLKLLLVFAKLCP